MGIDAFGCILLALGALVLPMKWFWGAILAALFHELCHAAAARCIGCRVRGLRFGWSGAGMEVAPMTRRQELVCAMAGPLGSLGLCVFLRIYPALALMGCCQGIVNLLPLYHLDGGRIAKCLMRAETAGKVQNLTWCGLFILAAILLFQIPAAGCILFSFLFSRKMDHPRKSSCKESNPAVQ